MPVRYFPLATGEFYHIFNRGSARQPIFNNKRDYERFVLTFSYYRFNNPPVKLSRFINLPDHLKKELILDLNRKNEKLVDVLCFVLMPNHFHFLLQQLSDNGISTFIRKTNNSWSRYFNTKYNRPGTLFQGVFKAKHIETDEQLLHLSRYIHLNPLTSYVVKDKDFLSYQWSSLSLYLNNKPNIIPYDAVNTKIILTHFSSGNSYKQFVLDQRDYAKQIEKIKHLTFEK